MQVESNARSGSTYDHYGTIARTRATERASAEVRSTLGGMDQSNYVAQAADAYSGNRIALANRYAQGNAAVTAFGGNREVRDAGNRAALASQDASSAVQLMTRGMTTDQSHATRVGAASATAVGANSNYWLVMVSVVRVYCLLD